MKNLEKLLLELQNGNSAALDKIYALTSKALFSLALSILKDRSLSEDALQDTYLIVFKSKNYKIGGNAFSWIYTICKNCSLKILNSRRQMVFDYDLENLKLNSFTEISENKIFLIQLMNNLKQTEREIVLLKAYAGLKHKEIAKILDLPEGTVRSTYTAALKKLKEADK